MLPAHHKNCKYIYHDFLPTPRRGSHIKSDKTHSQQDTPLSPVAQRHVNTYVNITKITLKIILYFHEVFCNYHY